MLNENANQYKLIISGIPKMCAILQWEYKTFQLGHKLIVTQCHASFGWSACLLMFIVPSLVYTHYYPNSGIAYDVKPSIVQFAKNMGEYWALFGSGMGSWLL